MHQNKHQEPNDNRTSKSSIEKNHEIELCSIW